jgi:hypothetical protein
MPYRKILFFYSVLVSTLFLAWVIISQAAPFNLVILLLFLPIALHFWLSISMRPHKNAQMQEKTDSAPVKPQGKILTRLFLIILTTTFISSLSIVIFSYYNPSQKKDLTDEIFSSEINLKLKDLSGQIGKLESEVKDSNLMIGDLKEKNLLKEEAPSALGASTISQNPSSTDSAGLVQVTDKGTVSVYGTPSLSSKVIGKAENKKIYPFSEKKAGWYLIAITDKEEGYIPSQFVKEL